MPIAEQLQTIAENQPKVYQAGADHFGLKMTKSGTGTITLTNVHTKEHDINVVLATIDGDPTEVTVSNGRTTYSFDAAGIAKVKSISPETILTLSRDDIEFSASYFASGLDGVLKFDENNSITGPTTEAHDGYAVSLGYENMAIPFEKEMGIDDYSITSEPFYYFDENEQLIFSDSKIDEGTLNGSLNYNEYGGVERIPQVLYYNTTNIQDLTIYVEFVEGNQANSEYTYETTTDGRTKVSLYPAYDYLGDRMYKIIPCQYSITFKKNLPTPCYFGYRFGSVSGDTYYKYVNLSITEFPIQTGIYKSDILDDASNVTGKMIHVNYLIPKIEGSNYAPISLGYAGVAAGMGASNFGYRNVSIGNGTLNGGYHNKTISDTGASVGCNNINYGNASFVGGTGNTNNTGNAIVHGYANVIEGKNGSSAIFGDNNIVKKSVHSQLSSISNFCAGTNNTLGENALTSGVIGAGNIVNQEGATAFGLKNTNTSKGGLVGGESNSVTNGGRLIVYGKNNKVLGTNHGGAIFGCSNTVEASNNHNEGLESCVLCVGRNNKLGAAAAHSVIAGNGNTVGNRGSVVFGEYNKTEFAHNLIAGHNCVSNANVQRIFGKFNKVDASTSYVDIVAWGNDENSRKNIYTLDRQGNAVFTGTILCSEVDAEKLELESTHNRTLVTKSYVQRRVTELNNNITEATKDLVNQDYVDNTVKTEIKNLVDSAPEALDTLGELAKALNSHEDAYDALLETVGNKVDRSELVDYATKEYADATKTEAIAYVDEKENRFAITSGEGQSSIVQKQTGLFNDAGQLYRQSTANGAGSVAFGSANDVHAGNGLTAGHSNDLWQYNAFAFGGGHTVGDQVKHNRYHAILDMGVGETIEDKITYLKENWDAVKEEYNQQHPEDIIKTSSFANFQHLNKISFGFAAGTSNIVTGRSAIALGGYLDASTEYKVALGSFNEDKGTTTVLEVGYGTGREDRKNAFEVMKDGSAKVAVQGTSDNSVVLKKTLNNYVPIVNSTASVSYRVYGIDSKGGQVTYQAANGVAANAIAKRDARGGCQFADPQYAQDAATKKYVDTAIDNVATKEYVEQKLAEINTALEEIIKIQNSLIGGNE